MARLFYANIELQHAQVLSYVRMPVWDGPTYLYTRHMLRVRGLFNPYATSWDLPGKVQNFFPLAAGAAAAALRPGTGLAAPVYTGPTPLFNPGGSSPATPPAGGGSTGPTTDLAIRHALAQPRQTLALVIGGQAVLLAPALLPDGSGSQYPADETGGPMPTVNDVTYCEGVKSWLVDLSIHTDLNECDLFRGGSSGGGAAAMFSALLSHRWVMHDHIDQDALTARTIRGHAVFRLGRLAQLGLVPDDYRAWLFHPRPLNFKRLGVDTWASEDGTTLEYQIYDQEMPINVTEQTLTVSRIEATHTCGIGRMHPYDASVATTMPFINALTSLLNPMNWYAAAQISIQAGIQGALVAQSSKPRINGEIMARVWGTRQATRRGLYLVGLTVLADRLGLVLAARPGAGIAATMHTGTEDIMGQFVEVHGTYLSGPGQNDPLQGGFPVLPLGEAGWSAETPLTSKTDPATNVLPGDTESRGTYTRRAMAQALQSPCGISPKVSEPAIARSIVPGGGND